ncbi:ATP-binding protein, partial [Streptomyces sp. NPDC004561]
MAAIPTQRESEDRATRVRGRATLPGSPLAPGSARALVRADLLDVPEVAPRLVDDALAVVSELVTNAVVHAGTDVQVDWRLEETGAFVVEVRDQHPTRPPRDGAAGEAPYDIPEYGRGLRLVGTACSTARRRPQLGRHDGPVAHRRTDHGRH